MDENKESLNVSDLGAHLPALATGLSGEDRAGLVSALKNNKLQSLAGLHSDVLENLNPKVGKRKRVELLREIQSQHDELKAKFFEERAALEAKYQKIYEPLYKKRYEIVNGVVEVENVAKENAEETKTDDKGLRSFWLTAMKTNDVLTEEIHKQDEKALKFLKDIKWSRIDDPKGFKLEFFFNSNPYFKNSVLTITYHMINDDKPIVEKVIGTEIEWYPGKCLTRMILKKTNAKPFPKKDYKSYCKSFFNFFNTLRVLEDDELINQMEYDYYIGSTIRDKIIPHAVSWFTGEAAQDDNLQDLMGDDDGEDNDEDEEEDDADEYEEGELEEWFTEIYYVCSGNMSSDSSQKQRLRNPQMSGGYTQQGYHEPRPPTWGPPGESQMQSQMSGAYTLQGYHEPRPPTWGPPGGSQMSAGYTQQGYYEPQPPTWGPPGGSQMQSQMSGAYTRQGYHEPRPPTWGPPGGSKMQQQPGYGYMQPGSYPTQPQYYMYPSSYPLQSSNQQTQQTATKTGLITMASNSNRNISELCVDGTTRND